MVLNVKAVVGTLSILLFFLGIALLLPLVVGLWYREPSAWSFGVTSALALVVGGAGWRITGGSGKDLQIREGFAIVALTWWVLSLVGALPFVIGGVLTSYSDAFFETMSGFTTTGATILGGAHSPDIEELPNAFLFWRSFMHWLGGMGIIVLTLAILPILGIGGMQLFKAEVPGPSADKLTPRIQETAKRLWMIYVGITAIQVVLLWPAMGFFDAVNHAFATMATGGFSTENGSVGQYQSAYIEWVITVFMVLAGINFALHFRLLRGHFDAISKDTELKVYLSILLVATLLITVANLVSTAEADAVYQSVGGSVRAAAFQAVAIVTTTGFGTADYEIWHPLAVAVIFALFFTGGMAGSTGGGVKVIRVVLLIKNSLREIRQLIHPNAVIPVRLNEKVVSQEIMRNVLSFFVLYATLLGAGTIAMAATGLDLMSAFSVTMSCVGNVGPAFGDFGPTENYASISAFGKWLLSFLMMAGRLEIFTVMILFSPAFWKR